MLQLRQSILKIMQPVENLKKKSQNLKDTGMKKKMHGYLFHQGKAKET